MAISHRSSLDAAGNNSSLTIGTNNELTGDGAFTYLYDDEGRPIKRTDLAAAYETHTNGISVVDWSRSSSSGLRLAPGTLVI